MFHYPTHGHEYLKDIAYRLVTKSLLTEEFTYIELRNVDIDYFRIEGVSDSYTSAELWRLIGSLSDDIYYTLLEVSRD